MQKGYNELTIVYIASEDENMGLGLGLGGDPLVARDGYGNLWHIVSVRDDDYAEAHPFSPDEYQYYTDVAFKENVHIPMMPHYVPCVLSKSFIEILKDAGIDYNGVKINWQPLQDTECLFAYDEAKRFVAWKEEKFSAYALFIKNKLSDVLRSRTDSLKTLSKIREALKPLYYLHDHWETKSRETLYSFVILIRKMQNDFTRNQYDNAVKISLQMGAFPDQQSAELAINKLETELKNMIAPLAP